MWMAFVAIEKKRRQRVFSILCFYIRNVNITWKNDFVATSWKESKRRQRKRHINASQFTCITTETRVISEGNFRNVANVRNMKMVSRSF